jgi:hypothetical protein
MRIKINSVYLPIHQVNTVTVWALEQSKVLVTQVSTTTPKDFLLIQCFIRHKMHIPFNLLGVTQLRVGVTTNA